MTPLDTEPDTALLVLRATLQAFVDERRHWPANRRAQLELEWGALLDQIQNLARRCGVTLDPLPGQSMERLRVRERQP